VELPRRQLTRKAGAALAAGCTVVSHPSAETPLSALALAELAGRAGLPKGVFNVVPGDAAEIVGAWMDDVRVRALAFTGSTEIGRLLYRQAAATVKRLVLALGGHAPFIVFADADMELTVDEAMMAKFATTGQNCLGANRFYVERTVYDEFCKSFTERVKALTLRAGRATARGRCSSPRPCSPTCPTTPRSCARKPSGPSRRSRPSTARTRWWPAPTTPSTGSCPICTPRTRAASTAPRARCSSAWWRQHGPHPVRHDRARQRRVGRRQPLGDGHQVRLQPARHRRERRVWPWLDRAYPVNADTHYM
jgi:hypothetical protein